LAAVVVGAQVAVGHLRELDTKLHQTRWHSAWKGDLMAEPVETEAEASEVGCV
jgi:hypothetical protein